MKKMNLSAKNLRQWLLKLHAGQRGIDRTNAVLIGDCKTVNTGYRTLEAHAQILRNKEARAKEKKEYGKYITDLYKGISKDHIFERQLTTSYVEKGLIDKQECFYTVQTTIAQNRSRNKAGTAALGDKLLKIERGKVVAEVPVSAVYRLGSRADFKN